MRRASGICLATALGLTLLQGTAGADAPGLQQSLTAVRTERPPHIDGRLDDSVWLTANPDSRFTQKFPDEGAFPTEPLELLVLYDDVALYIGVRCADSHPDLIVGQRTRRDRENDSDRVSVDISSRNDGTTAYHFELNIAGVQVDGMRFNDNEYSGEWDAVWLGAAARDADGWTAEIMIPLDALRYHGDADTFGLQVRRYLPRRQEIDEWSYIPRTSYREVSRYGRLEGLFTLRPRRLLHVIPYGMGRIAAYRNQPGVDPLIFRAEAGVLQNHGL
jgi:hypothetical protein